MMITKETKDNLIKAKNKGMIFVMNNMVKISKYRDKMEPEA